MSYLLLPLISSLLYVLGILLIKRSTDFGVGLWRTAFVANIAMGLAFAPLLLLGGALPTLARLWQPAVVALLLLAGQVAVFYALSHGDVSVATPLLGIKTLLVALFASWLQAGPVPLRLWIAASLSTAAIALLHVGPAGSHRRIGVTVLCALIAAVTFALFDILVQHWSPVWGTGRFLPLMAGLVALYSVVLLPFFRAPLRSIPRPAWPWLLGGAGLLALQSVVLIYTLARFGNATAVNIVYNARGLWTVAAIWLVGHWFANREQQLGARVLRWRLTGAALMTSAIVLVLR